MSVRVVVFTVNVIGLVMLLALSLFGGAPSWTLVAIAAGFGFVAGRLIDMAAIAAWLVTTFSAKEF